MALVFGGEGAYRKLKSKYRGQTKKYLKELRAEQENFLHVYKFAATLTRKIQ
jgi:hypothetical protein